MSTHGFDKKEIDMTEVNEPATGTHPVNWRVIQEVFPDTNPDEYGNYIESCSCGKDFDTRQNLGLKIN